MKVQVPKETIDRLMKEYGCTQEEATQAYLTASENAKQSFEDTLSHHLKHPKKGVREARSFTPRQIKDHLDKFVIGQEDYKKRLSIAAAYHFAVVKKLRHSQNGEFPIKRFRKKNTIISGPSGSGKTYCAEVLGDLLEVPVNIVDSTDYTEAGYVGKNAEDMIRELIDMAPGTTKWERADFVTNYGGLIFIDEIDKKAKDGNLIGHDISREGFQRSVLKLIERKQVSIDNPYSPSAQIQEMMDQQRGVQRDKSQSMISTENILFVLGGSFQRPNDDLERIVKKRLDHKSGLLKEDGSVTIAGFIQEGSKPTPQKGKFRNYFKEAEADDYIRFGLIPELVGRAPIRTYVNPLSKNDLVRIMTNTEDSILHQYTFEFELFDIEVEFLQEAIEAVAEMAENKKTGARALVSVWEEILTDFQFDLPGTNFKKLVVSRELCEKPKEALLKLLEKSPFIDFVEHFRSEHGIELAFGEEVERYLTDYAQSHGMDASTAIKTLLQGASALNYMGIRGTYPITLAMIQDPKFFDKLFTEWHDKQQAKAGVRPENPSSN